MSILSLVAKHVVNLVPYASARRLFKASEQGAAKPVWLNANEAPTGKQYSLDTTLYNRYPDCQPDAVIAGYANYTGLNKEQVLVSRGADEGIELLIRGFCDAGKDSIMICPPTYGMYAISARTCDIGVVEVPLIHDFQLDVKNIIAQLDHVKIVFICAPNNPTGTLPARADIEAIIDAAQGKALVVIDEAYVEFAQETALGWLVYEHVVVLRTLSKAFGLAGLRCGFTLAHPSVIETLLKVIAPYPLSAPVADIAAQALSHDGLGTMRAQVNQILANQKSILTQLSTLGDIELVGAQHGNFILFRTAYKDALMAHLVKHKVFIRDQSKQPQLENCLRISTGTQEENTQLLSLIEQFYTTQGSTRA
ncbi:histidinol-phosphate transaminase [Alteromonas sp. LMIT006]|uniref:histidinol-phosphate transaminase n=1 Tax=Alteromonadaceae TaxID=72275 RepID=UPI0020CA614D|nr:histidinol-phosphate transaminase [Alteromonas sp. LMIT006]UTP72540.1 histidinol-phosphate transaminase [Alteromonas sp. LMIT006]